MGIKIFDYNIFDEELNNIVVDTKIINTINPHSYCAAKKDAEFKESLRESNILLPDGIGIVWAVKLLLNKQINKIAGSDIHRYLLEKANTKKLKVFYLGASQITLNIIKNKLHNEYPYIRWNHTLHHLSRHFQYRILKR